MSIHGSTRRRKAEMKAIYKLVCMWEKCLWIRIISSNHHQPYISSLLISHQLNSNQSAAFNVSLPIIISNNLLNSMSAVTSPSADQTASFRTFNPHISATVNGNSCSAASIQSFNHPTSAGISTNPQSDFNSSESLSTLTQPLTAKTRSFQQLCICVCNIIICGHHYYTS